MAGSWTTYETSRGGADTEFPTNIFSISATFTADASNATVPNLVLGTNVSGILIDIGMVFDGVATPDTVTVTLQDADTLSAGSGTLTASGRYQPDYNAPLIGGGSIIISGNTVNSAKCKVVLYFLDHWK